MFRCPVCNKESIKKEHFYCKNCAWDFSNDPTITNFANKISENNKKLYLEKLELHKNNFNTTLSLKNELDKIKTLNQNLLQYIDELTEKLKNSTPNKKNNYNNFSDEKILIAKDGFPFIKFTNNKFISLLPITKNQFNFNRVENNNIKNNDNLKNFFITSFNINDLNNFIIKYTNFLKDNSSNIKEIRMSLKTDFTLLHKQINIFTEIQELLSSKKDLINNEFFSILDFLMYKNPKGSFYDLLNLLNCHELLKMGSDMNTLGTININENANPFRSDKKDFENYIFRLVIELEN